MNRPKLPPGQHITEKLPVLHVGSIPKFDPSTWDLVIDGEVENKLRLSWNEVLSLPKIVDVSDFHCVTTWSRLDCRWGGTRLKEIIHRARPKESVTTILITCDGGYTTDIPLDEGMKDNVLLANELDDEPLPPKHGGPLRLVVPDLYAWKAAKWVRRITFLDKHVLGYWESRGYSDTADPWTEDRYARKKR